MGCEDSEDWLQLIWVAAAALLVAAGIIAISGLSVPASEDMPAWVQAGGSIAAILAVLWVQRRDHERSDRLRLADAVDRAALEAEFLNMVIAYSRVTIGRARETSHSQEWSEAVARYALAQMQSHLQSFDAVSVAHLPNREVAGIYFRGRQAIIAGLRQVEMVLEWLPDQPVEEIFDLTAEIMDGLTPALGPWVAEKR